MKSDYICIDLKGPLKEKDGYRYNVTTVDYTGKIVEAEPLREKTGEAVAKCLYKLLGRYDSCDIDITE